jgi:hypothetical protein
MPSDARRQQAHYGGDMENQQQSSGGGGGSGRKPWAAFNIVERGEKKFWNRIGSAFKNRDGSYNIFLDAIPLGGKVQIREDDRTTPGIKPPGQLAAAAEEQVS